MRLTPAAVLLSLSACHCAHGPRVKFVPQDGYTSKGPGYYCVRKDAELVCLDFTDFIAYLKEHPEEMLREKGEVDTRPSQSGQDGFKSL